MPNLYVGLILIKKQAFGSHTSVFPRRKDSGLSSVKLFAMPHYWQGTCLFLMQPSFVLTTASLEFVLYVLRAPFHMADL